MASNPNVTALRCTVCGADYEPKPGRYVCEQCGEVGTLDVQYDYDSIEQSQFTDEASMWRYRPVMPIAPDAPTPPLVVGWTPLIAAPQLDPALGRVWIKDEGRQPTASLKDRASAMAVMRAQEEGADILTTASTGNAAAALAGLCAATDRRAVIFVPASAPEAKIAQLLAFGATVVLVDGTYTHAFEMCQRAAAEFGWYNRNTGFNPYVAEGKKTVALEIVDQLGRRAPDAVFVSVGDGSIIGGVHKGFKDARAMRWIDRVPRIFGIQAEGSDYLVQAFESGEDVTMKPPISATTRADSISADLPRDRVKALAAVTETGGQYLRVSDEAILAAIPDLAATTGVFAEPAAAAAYAGLIVAAYAGHVSSGDEIVVLSTGSGLKDVPAAISAVEARGTEPIRVAADAGTGELSAILSP